MKKILIISLLLVFGHNINAQNLRIGVSYSLIHGKNEIPIIYNKLSDSWEIYPWGINFEYKISNKNPVLINISANFGKKNNIIRADNFDNIYKIDISMLFIDFPIYYSVNISDRIYIYPGISNGISVLNFYEKIIPEFADQYEENKMKIKFQFSTIVKIGFKIHPKINIYLGMIYRILFPEYKLSYHTNATIKLEKYNPFILASYQLSPDP